MFRNCIYCKINKRNLNLKSI